MAFIQILGIVCIVYGGGYLAWVLWGAARGGLGARAVLIEAVRDVPLMALGVVLVLRMGPVIRLTLLFLVLAAVIFRIFYRLRVQRRTYR